MKNYFPLPGANYLNEFLGRHSSISLTEQEGKNERTVHIRRLDKETIELKMRHWDGMLLVLQVKFKEFLGSLIEPKRQGDTDEQLWVEQVYLSILDAMSDTET